jgi:DNA (cytosine-5)-methyltransferase 1
VGRVANGIPRRVDRLKALGNAVIPQIPEQIGRVIMEIEELVLQKSKMKRRTK